jgi:hypothetical protein
MKNIIEKAEIAFWDAAINYMSRDKTPRVYSQSLAQITLYLRPENPSITLPKVKDIYTVHARQLARLGIIALSGLAIGLLLAWLRTRI